MQTPSPVTQMRDRHAQEPVSPAEELEQAASIAELITGAALRAVEVAAMTLLALLICPPLLILLVVVIVPLFAMVVIVSLVGVVLATPYLLISHLRGHPAHRAALLRRRLRHAARAVVDLLPHRIAAGDGPLDHRV